MDNAVKAPRPLLSVLQVRTPDRISHSLLTMLNGLAEIQVVYCAGDAERAWETLTAYRPEVMLVDWDLPAAGAAALISRARQAFADLQCVAIVGGQAEQRAARQAGAQAALLRGFTLDEFAAVLRICAPAPDGRRP